MADYFNSVLGTPSLVTEHIYSNDIYECTFRQVIYLINHNLKLLYFHSRKIIVSTDFFIFYHIIHIIPINKKL